MQRNTETNHIPTHVAIIMDGNRRWARRQGLDITEGHRHVANEVIKDLAEHAIERNIEFLTLWAFSTENWKRPEDEVTAILELFREAFDKSAKKLHEKGVRLEMIGDLDRFPDDIRENVRHWIQETKDNETLTVTFALNYGGRDEIIRAVKSLATDVVSGELSLHDIDEDVFSQHLDTAGTPDPDLIIRPGGEQRLSGFLPWQAEYSEYYFTDTLMPDFSPVKFDEALDEFERRQRRFGE